MGWLIALGVIVAIVVTVVVMFKRGAAWQARQRAEEIERMRGRLKEGVHFEGRGSFGNTIKGKVIKVIDRHTVEAFCKAYDDQPGEVGKFPISSIERITRG